MIKNIKRLIEDKRGTRGSFWMVVVFIKDALWITTEIVKKMVTIPSNIIDLFFYFLDPPIISPANHIFLADSKTLPEFKGGIFNPGAINYLDDVVLLARAEKHPTTHFIKNDERFNDTCRPLLAHFNKNQTKFIKINIDYNNKSLHRMEDFRLFKYQKKLYSNLSLVQWKADVFKENNSQDLLERKMMIAELNLGQKKLEGFLPIHTDLKESKIEKNWVFFEDDKNLYLIYSFSPYYKVLKMYSAPGWHFDTIVNKKIDLLLKGFSEKFLSLSTNPINYDKNNLFLLIHFRDRDKNIYSYKFWGVLLDKETLLPKKITNKPLFRSRAALWASPKQIIYVSSVVNSDDNFICFFGKGDKKTYYSKLGRETLESSWINISNN